MLGPMHNPLTKKRADHSTMEIFSFSFYCDMCEKEWRSARYAFNSGSLAAPIDPMAFQLLWNEQHKAAYERANRDASFQFNRCPVCGRWVCRGCFYLSEVGVSDICKECLRFVTKIGAQENVG
jgi:hypothetical protein